MGASWGRGGSGEKKKKKKIKKNKKNKKNTSTNQAPSKNYQKYIYITYS